MDRADGIAPEWVGTDPHHPARASRHERAARVLTSLLVARAILLSLERDTSVMRGRSIGQAKFICAKCGHGVAATWRKRTKMYEGRCIHCEQWTKYLRPNTPAVPVLD